ncbi:MAG: hypothetical protein WDM86_21865 [Rhizomicrobium sp.]
MYHHDDGVCVRRCLRTDRIANHPSVQRHAAPGIFAIDPALSAKRPGASRCGGLQKQDPAARVWRPRHSIDLIVKVIELDFDNKAEN